MNVGVKFNQHYLKSLVLVVNVQIMVLVCLWPSHAAEIDRVWTEGNAIENCENSNQNTSAVKKFCIYVVADNLKSVIQELHIITNIEFVIPTALESVQISRMITAQTWNEVIRSLLESYNTVEFTNNEGVLQRIVILDKGEEQVFTSTVASTPTTGLLPPPPQPPPLPLPPPN